MSGQPPKKVVRRWGGLKTAPIPNGSQLARETEKSAGVSSRRNRGLVENTETGQLKSCFYLEIIHVVIWQRVKLVFLRELRDQLRDTRTIVILIGLPVALYLILGIGFVRLAPFFAPGPAVVVVVGSAPDSNKLLDSGRISSRWLDETTNAGRLHVISDRALNLQDAASEALMDRAREIAGSLNTSDVQAPDGAAATTLISFRKKAREMLAEAGISVLIAFPPESATEPDDTIDRYGDVQDDRAVCSATPLIIFNSTDAASRTSHALVRRAIIDWQHSRLDQRLSRAGFAEGLVSSYAPASLDLASHEQQISTLSSILFPILIVIMTVVGAFYPAIDMCAGERERGTIETLLVSPATRTEIVTGKFFMVLLFSCTSTFLNLLSMGLIGQSILAVAGKSGALSLATLQIPALETVCCLFGAIVLISAPFSALSLAFAAFARSTKEAQFYLSPLILIALLLTATCQLPGMTLTHFSSALPVIGPTLWLKELLACGLSLDAASTAPMVFVASIGYSLLALRMAVTRFEREEIVLPPSGGFCLFSRLSGLIRNRYDVPTPAIAAACYAAILLLQSSGAAPTEYLLTAIDALNPIQMWWELVGRGLGIMAPALILGLLLTRNPVSTFQLHTSRASTAIAAITLAICTQPMILELSHLLGGFYPPLCEGPTSPSPLFNTSPTLFGLMGFGIALIPCVCEEVAFRGLILGGLRGRHRPLPAILVSSLLFGAIYSVPQQAFNATMIGLFAGLLAHWTRSLLPSIVFHVTAKGVELFWQQIRLDLLPNDWL